MERDTSKTSFSCLPPEIILIIFDYLSSNDILYTFFFLTERLNNLLLHNQRHFKYFELPTANMDTWEIILSMIGSQIKCLNITTIHFSFPLRYFSNLKSLIISSSYGLSEEKLKYIIESDQFRNLSSFKIQQERIFPNPFLPDNVIYEDNILNKVFNPNNSLEIFEYSLMIPSYPDNLQMNFNLHSLTLTLNTFRSMFIVIQYTPNLKYLNVKTRIPLHTERPIDKINTKLKQLYLTLHKHNDYVNLDLLIDGIKQFSSSLDYLSLDFSVRGINEFLFNSLQFPRLLESMKELKQFHFYMKLPSFQYHDGVNLSQFKDHYCFNHNSSFGIYDDYVYTLPFHFNNIYDCFQDFNEIKLNNCENNSRIWYNVKSIQLPPNSGYNRNFVKELKTKMPKLTLIRFDSYAVLPKIETHDSFENKDDVTLDNVTTIQILQGSIEKYKDWIIYLLPNLKHLIISHTYTAPLPSINSELAPILNKNIQRVDIDACCEVEQLAEISYVYLSNVQNINFYLNGDQKNPEWYADIIIKILKNFQNLKILMIRIAHKCDIDGELSFVQKNLNKIIECFNMSEMHKKYQVEYLKEYTLFSRTYFEIYC